MCVWGGDGVVSGGGEWGGGVRLVKSQFQKLVRTQLGR